MRILALETSETAGSVAALEGNILVAQLPLDPALRSAKSLAPAIAELLSRLEWPATSIELVAVTSGPGSFTGLRIGVTTAKAFAYGVDCQVVGVNTLEVIAEQAKEAAVELEKTDENRAPKATIWAAIDAQRQQFFVAQFSVVAGGALACRQPTHLVDQPAWLGALKAGEVICGPGLARCAETLPAGVVVAPQQLWQPMAETVGRLGYRAWHAGQRDTPLTLLPQYFRRTAAEEQWDKREARNAERGTRNV